MARILHIRIIIDPLVCLIMTPKYLPMYLHYVGKKVAPSLVHLDQVGFVKGHHASSNVRRLFQVINRAASDKVEWPYLLYTLKICSFGPVITKWIRTLYYKPLVYVQTNGIVSAPFELTRFTRQGCPVSPVPHSQWFGTRTPGMLY